MIKHCFLFFNRMRDDAVFSSMVFNSDLSLSIRTFALTVQNVFQICNMWRTELETEIKPNRTYFNEQELILSLQHSN